MDHWAWWDLNEHPQVTYDKGHLPKPEQRHLLIATFAIYPYSGCKFWFASCNAEWYCFILHFQDSWGCRCASSCVRVKTPPRRLCGVKRISAVETVIRWGSQHNLGKAARNTTPPPKKKMWHAHNSLIRGSWSSFFRMGTVFFNKLCWCFAAWGTDLGPWRRGTCGPGSCVSWLRAPKMVGGRLTVGFIIVVL